MEIVKLIYPNGSTEEYTGDSIGMGCTELYIRNNNMVTTVDIDDEVIIKRIL